MCVAVLVKPGHRLTIEQMLSMYDTNPDGYGFGGIRETHGARFSHTVRGLRREDISKDYDRFLSEIDRKSPHLAHFRIATSGRVDTSNCHPFYIKDGILVHNGVLSYGSLTDSRSDTAHFTSRLYQQLGEDAVLPNLEEFEKIIGYNKIILLWKSGRYAIANEKSGAWIDDDTIWVSNMPGKYRCKK